MKRPDTDLHGAMVKLVNQRASQDDFDRLWERAYRHLAEEAVDQDLLAWCRKQDWRPRELTAPEFEQIRRIVREAGKGTWFPEWAWISLRRRNAEVLGMTSNRSKHVLQAYRALKDAGWDVKLRQESIERWTGDVGKDVEVVMFKDVAPPTSLGK
jgi:hypothetical protein